MDLDEITDFKLNLFSNEAVINTGFADDFSMLLKSEKTGSTMTANATLVIDLELYPSSSPAIF